MLSGEVKLLKNLSTHFKLFLETFSIDPALTVYIDDPRTPRGRQPMAFGMHGSYLQTPRASDQTDRSWAVHNALSTQVEQANSSTSPVTRRDLGHSELGKGRDVQDENVAHESSSPSDRKLL